MKERFQRLELLIGEEGMEYLSQRHVAIFGLGGVGGYIGEALARSGIGRLTLVDYDQIDITNINRQIIALESTLGEDKTAVLGERLRQINPDIQLNIIQGQYGPENWQEFFPLGLDYVADAIDMISSKIHLILKAKEKNIPIISSMGMGNKLDPTKIKVTDLYKTHTCPLAKVMRKELKERGVDRLLCVFSEELPLKPVQTLSSPSKRQVPGSSAFVPPAAGLVMASVIVRDLLENHGIINQNQQD